MGRSHQRTFYDATVPSNIPSGSLAGVYAGYGSYQWPQSEVDRMAGVFGIYTGTDPHGAVHARCCDVEPGADKPAMVAAFVKEREHLGHHDAISYSDESEWEAIEKACIDAGVYPAWWIASPGNNDPAALRSPIRKVQPVAVQNEWTNGFDRSVILGDLRFTLPRFFQATG